MKATPGNSYEEALRDQLQTEASWESPWRKRHPEAAYSSLYDFVLREGSFWVPAPHEHPQDRPRACFNNALMAAVSYGLRYVEGFASSATVDFFPIHHAWAATEDGYVVDTTWPTPGRAYLGVEFDPAEAFEARQHGGTILDNWPNGYPVLQKERVT